MAKLRRWAIVPRVLFGRAQFSDAVVGVGPAGLGKEAAVHAEGLPANERGVFAQQELDSGSDVVGCADAAKRRKASPGVREAGDFFFGALGVDRAWRHAIHANSEWAQFQRGRFGEHFDAAFAGGVAGKIGEGNFVATGADVDDSARAVFFHVASGALSAEVAAFKIGRNHAIPFRFFDVQQRLENLDAGIVDQRVETAEGGEDFFKHGIDVLGIGDVGVNSDGAPTVVQ